MTLLTETRERFLLAILGQVPAERIAEIHFFSPIRQGGIESGVAVVVDTGEPPVAVADASGSEEVFDVAEPSDPSEPSNPADSADGALGSSVPAELDVPPNSEMADTSEISDAPAAGDAAGSPAATRYVVHTARYRLTLKGIDRGKWETSVFAEADAPLVTVDAVVRGVQRRAGDVDDAIRMDGDEVRAFAASRPVTGTGTRLQPC